MFVVTTCKIKPYMTKAETAEMMTAFAETGTAKGEIAHYVAGDNSWGMTIHENDDVAGSYRNMISYSGWIEFDSKVMLTIDEAVPLLLDALA
jgi:GTP cyclohydrolase III